MTQCVMRRVRDILGCLEPEALQPLNGEFLNEEWACTGTQGAGALSLDIMSFLENGEYDTDMSEVITPEKDI